MLDADGLAHGVEERAAGRRRDARGEHREDRDRDEHLRRGRRPPA
jgi:hypothetical protein